MVKEYCFCAFSTATLRTMVRRCRYGRISTIDLGYSCDIAWRMAIVGWCLHTVLNYIKEKTMKIIENIGNHTSESIINVEIIAAAVIGGGALLNGGKTGPNNCAKWMLVSRIPRASAPPPFFFF